MPTATFVFNMLREGQETWDITHFKVTYGKRFLMLPLKHGAFTDSVCHKLVHSGCHLKQNKYETVHLMYMHFL